MKKSRLEYSIINSSISMIVYIIRLVIQFASRSFFIYFLGAKYLGLNGLFTNILSFLSLAELGIGTSIVYSLYKPLAKDDQLQIIALMNLYKKSYEVIGIFVGVLGLLLIPFLHYLINDDIGMNSIYIYYVLFLANSSLSYFFTYKRSLIIADQKNYINSMNDLLFLIIMNVVQIVSLYIYSSFSLFLIIQIVATFISNLSISHIVDKKYPYLKSPRITELEAGTKKEIKKNIIGNVSSKIGGVIVMGTDNILISSFISLTAVGTYSNYSLITVSVQNLCKQVTNSVTASIGNFAATASESSAYELFKKHFFINHSLAYFTTTILVAIINPFINLWVGDEYVLSNLTTGFICLNYAVQVYRNTGFVFIESFGLYWFQRKKPILEAGLNLVISLVLLIVFKMGINGVLIGTIISSLGFVLWYEASVVYKYVFKRSFSDFVILFTKYFFDLLLAVVATTLFKVLLLGSFSGILSIIFAGGSSVLISGLLYYLLYRKKSEFQFVTSIYYRIKKRM
ncbi:lipopolysaccharide biosynthesis protein [Enterococcus sp. AZ109]|uniref:lipopolysaccharide biosynthesis protein n=1 Tax=Enterococcus sp. AZ109 TaxID=2774634 RepID=UPI003F6841B7